MSRDLDSAASHVVYEWVTMAEMTAELAGVAGARSVIENALLEALLVHNRCLVNFVSGDWLGRHGKRDIQPQDFLGYPWWPSDEEFDRELRGRLSVINKHLAHLSWDRVADRAPVMWSVVLISHQSHWGMKLFTEEARRAGSNQAEAFEEARDSAEGVLPRLGRVGETTPVLAPRRAATA